MKAVERFEIMNSVNLGCCVNPLASAYLEFFKMAEKSNQFDVHDLKCILPTLTGYAINNPDDLSVVNCLDLCYVNIKSIWFIEDFERYLMMEENWLCQYKYALEVIAEQSAKERSRKIRKI